MSTVNVHIGRWQDHSHRSVALGDVVTLDVRSAGYLIAALSTLIGFVGAATWSLTAFTIHQCRVTDSDEDAVYHQLQVLFRNSSSPFSALLDIAKICIAWRKPDGPARLTHLKARCCLFALPPLLILVGFAVAGIFVSEVAGKSYASNNVLINPGECGTFVFDDTTEGARANAQKLINDTIAGRAYVDNCYGSDTKIAQCSLYPTQSIPHRTTQVECPFGKDASGTSLCLHHESGAAQIDTGLLDSNDVFGINAAPRNRVLTSKRLTCSPVNATSYVTVVDGTNPIQLLNIGPVYGVSDYTYRYHTQTKSDGVGYQIFSLPAGFELWSPIPPIQVTSGGDVSAVILTANSVRYAAPVDDAWFSAHVPVDLGPVLPTEYVADTDIAVMACIDQAQVCNPNTAPFSCTIMGSLSDLATAYQLIGLNAYQEATAGRLLFYLANTPTFNSINALGDNALLARRNFFQDISSGLSSVQWQLEMVGWFDTSLAMIQAHVLESVTNSITNSAALAQYGSVVPPYDAVAASFCHAQRVRNTGGYQTFSFLGLMIVCCIGAAIIISSWIVEPIVAYLHGRPLANRRHGSRENARIEDLKFHLLRGVLEDTAVGSGRDGWEKLRGVVPVTAVGCVFPYPRRGRAEEQNAAATAEESKPMIINSQELEHGKEAAAVTTNLTEARNKTLKEHVQETREGKTGQGENETIQTADVSVDADDTVDGDANRIGK